MSTRRGTLRRAGAAIGLAGLLATVAACTTLPPAGRIKLSRLPGVTGPPQQGVVQFVPVGPAAGWSPADIVRGFMIASAAFTNDASVSVAREYLASGYRNRWDPKAAGWAATVVDDSAAISKVSPLSPHVNGETNTAVVNVTSRGVATLYTGGHCQAGQCLVSTAPKPLSFGLVLTTQGWRINSLPWSTLLLLTRSDFLRDYQPRNLYFVAANAPHRLLPDPVFIPQKSGAGDTVRGLVEGLLPHGQGQPGPNGWLAGVATTAFPAGTGLLDVEVTGSQATVDLGGNARKATQAQRQEMAAQLVWSLAGSSYGTPTEVRSVVMQIDHRDWQPHGQPLQLFNDYRDWVPVTQDSPVYFQRAAPGLVPQVKVLPETSGSVVPLPLPDGLGRGPLTALAISPGPTPGAVLASCRGRTIFLVRLVHASVVRRQSLPARCTSLSWDRQDDLWVTTRNGPLVLIPPAKPGGRRQLRLVVAPAPTLQPPRWPSVLRIAPDGVRAAMIVTAKGATKVLVGAISQHAGSYYLAPSSQTATVGSDIHGRPIALSWWDSDHLLVLAQPAAGGSAARLYEVPLSGGLAVQVPTPPAGSQWLAVTGTTVVIGAEPRHESPFGRVWRMSGLNSSWRPVTDGTIPVVPG